MHDQAPPHDPRPTAPLTDPYPTDTYPTDIHPTDTRPPVTHRAETTERGAFALARCVCGWTGPARRSRDRARTDAAEHLAASEG
ncbi:hypothetical protein ACFVQ4_14895 [Streptomyces laurentii]|uniref:hypothetical protein n=1 Tax=Streptomyces laurentii TaxID=39478 RepID=UPI0036BAD7E7